MNYQDTILAENVGRGVSSAPAREGITVLPAESVGSPAAPSAGKRLKEKIRAIFDPNSQQAGRIKVHEWSAWNYGSPGDCTWGMLPFVGLWFLRAVFLDALTGLFSDS